MEASQTRWIGYALLAVGVLLIMILAVVKVNTDREGAFMCELVEASPDLSMTDCPAHNSSTSWVVLVGFGFAALVLAAGAYLAFVQNMQGTSKPATKPKDIKLDSEESKVVEAIKQAGGSVFQGDIVRETEFSKVKVTRILDRLETKQVIERKRRGMTNLVVLK
ncbi:MAG: hypothetical protein ABIA93_05945 [Candidatus Woesearchaeota archaeon]